MGPGPALRELTTQCPPETGASWPGWWPGQVLLAQRDKEKGGGHVPITWPLPATLGEEGASFLAARPCPPACHIATHPSCVYFHARQLKKKKQKRKVRSS